MNSNEARLWGVEDVAHFLDVPVKTIYQWRTAGYGPKGYRVGRYVRFDPDDVRDWFRSLAEGGVA